MSFFAILNDWYKVIIAVPVVVTAGAWLWKNKAWIWEYILFFRNLKGRVENLEKPRSNEAKLCPDCDERMKVVRAIHTYWWYRCKECDKTFPYPAPGAKNAN